MTSLSMFSFGDQEEVEKTYPQYNANKLQNVPLEPNVKTLQFGDIISYDGSKWDYFFEKLFILSNNSEMNEIENYIIFAQDRSSEFDVIDNYFIYNGTNARKIILDIQLLYQWIDQQFPYKFKIELYINNIDNIIFSSLVGLSDFPNIRSLYSTSVVLDLVQNDRIYIKLTKNTIIPLQLNKNSNIKIKYIR